MRGVVSTLLADRVEIGVCGGDGGRWEVGGGFLGYWIGLGRERERFRWGGEGRGGGGGFVVYIDETVIFVLCLSCLYLD